MVCAAASSFAAAVSCAPTNAGQAVDAGAGNVQAPVAVNHQVKIEGFVFSPSGLSVKPGDTITFTNLDLVPHTATAKDRSWNTGNLAQNETATITVTAEMVTDYFCIYHPNMVATLSIA